MPRAKETTGAGRVKWRGNCPFPREIARGEAKKGRDGFIKLNVSSADKAFPKESSLATGFRALSTRQSREG